MTSDLSVPAPQPNPSTDDDFAAVDRYIAGREDASGIADELVRRYGGSGRAVELPGTLGGDDRLPADDDAVPIVPSARVDLDLDQIEARANAATACQPPGESYAVWRGKPEGSYPIAQTERGLQGWHDAEFIAHAREDVPRLVAEVRRLRGVADAALAELDRSLEARDRRAEAECDAARAEAERLEAECDSFARMYARTIERYDDLGMGVMQKIADRCSLTDVLNFVGDQLNECDHADDESIALWKRAAGVAAEAARVREALQAVRDRCAPSYKRAQGGALRDDYERGAIHALDEVYRLLDAALDGAE